MAIKSVHLSGDFSNLPNSRKAAREAGVPYYFTGVACKSGHTAPRDTGWKKCVECKKAHLRALYAAKPEKYKASAGVWYRSNKEASRQASTAWRARNPDQHREICRAATKKWRAANPAKCRASERVRRARKLNAEGQFDQEDIIRIRDLQRDRCGCCAKKLNGGGHVDHIRALARGGSNWPNNLQLLCEPCNHSKKQRDPIEFMQSRGRLI